MKKRLISLTCASICLLMMTISAFAIEMRASEQIISYSMNAVAAGDTIEVTFSVTGINTTSKLGCESIYIYEKSGTRWSLVENLTEDDFGMSRTNTYKHRNTIYCTGDADTEHRVVVTIFAENDAGRDTRTKTFYV